MPVETEAKMVVEDLEAVRARLGEAGATLLGRFHEINTFFDTEDRALLAGDEGLRLRINRDRETGRAENIVTFKGPLQVGALKTREEIEVTVGEPDQMAALFERLGYVRMMSFEKRRDSWKMADCKVELDELPHLGSFVEVEGPGERAVLKVRERLGLSDRPIVKTSYVAMLVGHLKQHGDVRLVRFSDAGPR